MKYKRIDITDAKAVQYTGGISSVQKIIEEIKEISKFYFEFRCGFNDEFIINNLSDWPQYQDKWRSVLVHKNDWLVLDEHKHLFSVTDEEFRSKFKPIEQQTDIKSSNKKVWIVTNGSHSDYYIVAVFTDKELAEKYRTDNKFDWLEEWNCDVIEA